jgi:hypothetical protein
MRTVKDVVQEIITEHRTRNGDYSDKVGYYQDNGKMKWISKAEAEALPPEYLERLERSLESLREMNDDIADHGF